MCPTMAWSWGERPPGLVPPHRHRRFPCVPPHHCHQIREADAATSHSVLKYVEEFNKKDGVTVLCALHFLSLARRYGTRIVGLKAGELVFDGLPSEIDARRFKEVYG